MSVNLQDYTNTEERMQALMDLPKASFMKDARDTFDPSGAVAVEMNEGGVTSTNAEYPALGTMSLATCIGVAVHNPLTKATGLVHVVSEGSLSQMSSESVKSLRAVLNNVHQGDGSLMEARLVGAQMGGSMQDGILNEIIDMLAEYDASILSFDVKGKPAPMHIAIDSARWEEGLVRGGSDSVDFLHDPETGGVEEMLRQKRNSVNLDDMVWLGASHDVLVYNGTEQDVPDSTLDI